MKTAKLFFLANAPEHLNESSQAKNWSFEALLLRGRREESEGRSQKKCFYKYEMLPNAPHYDGKSQSILDFRF
ncbi:hypothetical protein [Microcoleus vaginatus]|uniref:hypothetical protein n=1 Tax=Microcoleus vaginatus TaxID=119532 RepID=UPI004040A235